MEVPSFNLRNNSIYYENDLYISYSFSPDSKTVDPFNNQYNSYEEFFRSCHAFDSCELFGSDCLSSPLDKFSMASSSPWTITAVTNIPLGYVDFSCIKCTRAGLSISYSPWRVK